MHLAHWSIAQTKNRETEPSGIGWELFINYKIARDKYKPDYFLYENNYSMSAKIKEEITKKFGIEPVLIDSALVSAQSRKRLYWVGRRNRGGTYEQVKVEQPKDRGIILQDILDSGYPTREKGYTLKANYAKAGPSSAMDGGHFPKTMAMESVRIGTVESDEKSIQQDSQAIRVYSPYGKSVTLSAVGGGQGGKTGLYATPCSGGGSAYEVKDEKVSINGKRFPVKLPDGFYIIRKLTVTECKRLQTVPDSYDFPVSNTQAYKMLGNGWTVDVIAHIMSHFKGIKTEPVEVLSMYDGMSCGRLALNKVGANVIRYYATEIDKYAIKTTQNNFPDTIQLGDSFQVRSDGWRLKGGG